MIPDRFVISFTATATTITMKLDKPLDRVGFKRRFFLYIPPSMVGAMVTTAGTADTAQLLITDSDATTPSAYTVTDMRGDLFRLDALVKVDSLMLEDGPLEAYWSDDPVHVGLLNFTPRSRFIVTPPPTAG